MGGIFIFLLNKLPMSTRVADKQNLYPPKLLKFPPAMTVRSELVAATSNQKLCLFVPWAMSIGALQSNSFVELSRPDELCITHLPTYLPT